MSLWLSWPTCPAPTWVHRVADEIDQDRVDRFAAAAGDEQWIHTDPVRAKDGPARGPGYAPRLPHPGAGDPDVRRAAGERRGHQAQLRAEPRVRFPAPVPVGWRIRLSATLDEVTEIPGGLQIIFDAVVEMERAG